MFRSAFALTRASALTGLSYRIATVFSALGLIVSIVPIYFISGAIQPIAQASIQSEGGQYFGFVVVGIGSFYVLSAALGAIPNGIGGGLGSGTFEAMLATRARMPAILLGVAGYPLLHALARTLIVFVVASVLGAPIIWSQMPVAAPVVLLLIIAYMSIGLISAGLVLAFRTSGPLVTAVSTLSIFLGGVYYSTTVIPSWIQSLSAFVPLTYALRILRRLLLPVEPDVSIASDVFILTLITLVLFGVGSLWFAASLRYARRVGNLAQY